MSLGRPAESRWPLGAPRQLTNWRVFLAVALVSAAGLVAWALVSPVGWYDEGLSVYGALRVMDGDVPYRDFWTLYPPGQFYVMAALFKVFGPSLLVARLYSAAVGVLTALCSLRLTARLIPIAPAVIIALVVALTHVSLSWSFPAGPAVLLTLLGCILLAEHRDRGRPGLLWGAGLAAAGVVLFRHDMGLPLLLIEATFLFFAEGARASLRFLAAATLLLLPVVVVVFALVPLDQLYAQFVAFPKIYAKVRGLPFPRLFPERQPGQTGPIGTYDRLLMLQSWAFYFAPVVLVSAGAVIGRRWYLHRRFARVGSLPLLLWLVGMLYLANVRIRPDQAHVFAATVMALLVFGPLVVAPALAALGSIPLLVHRRAAFVATIGAAALLLAVPPALSVWVAFDQFLPGATFKRSALPRAGIWLNSAVRATGIEEAVNFVQGRVAPFERIFVGRLQHDRLISNDIMFYFLAARDANTRYFTMTPGLTNKRDIQEATVKDLEARPARYLVLTDIDGPLTEPNDSAKSDGVTVLDDYIRKNYVRQAIFGRYQILKRKRMH